MKKSYRSCLYSTSVVALLAAGAITVTSLPVQAQNAEQGILEEIVVTARKRSEVLQDVPFSIAALTETAMRNRGIRTLDDVAMNVAGFTVQNLGPGQSQVAIRGISAGQIVRDQPGVKEQVGVYLDESVISLSLFTPDIDLFDLNRVEVLRGPQGTLFGSGSLAGTVRFITNQPDLETAEVIAEYTAGLIGGSEFDGSVKAAVNVVLAPGKAALRVVGYYNSIGGFIDAVQPDLSVNKNANNGDRFGFRAALAIMPNENLKITPRILYQEIDINGFNRVDIFNILANEFTTTRTAVTLGKRQQFTQFQERFTDDFLLIDATVEYDFGQATFTSVTSFTNRDVVQLRDSTQLAGSVTGQPGVLAAAGLPENVFTLDAPLTDSTDVDTFTQEVRLTSAGDGPLQWIVGGFYSKIEREYGQNLLVAGFEALANPILIPELGVAPGWTAGVIAGIDELFVSDLTYDFKQFAVFGEATFDFSDQLSVTAGLRWFDFQEDKILNFDGIFAVQTINVPASTSSNDISPRVMLSYDVTSDFQFNMQAAKGFRLGGVNDPLNEPICNADDLVTYGAFPQKWGDETIWNYEIGAKATIMNGRGTFNVAAFYTDISNLQATLEAGSCSSRVIVNVPKARSMGIEAEVFVRPSEQFEFGIVASLIDSELRSTITDTNGNILSALEKGNRLPTVPRFQVAVTSTYYMPNLWEDMDGFITATVQHVGSRFTQFGDADPAFATIQLIPIGDPSITTLTFDPKMAAYTIGNLRFGVRNERYELAFFINNIWDEIAQIALDRERGNRARVGFLTNPPRTFGVTGRAYF